MGWYTTLAVVCAALAAASLLTPLPHQSLAVEQGQGVTAQQLALHLAHLATFACAFGTSIWFTFVAGIVLFSSLPRHQFGEIQAKLFPPYFRFIATTCSLALAFFAALHPLNSASPVDTWQMGFLALPVAGALVNLLILEPVVKKIMRERHRVEKEAGIGNEVGLSKNREVAKTNPELRALNKRFGMFHGFSSLANLLGLVGLMAHLYYVAARVAS